MVILNYETTGFFFRILREMRRERRFLKGLQKIVKGKRQCKPVVARISIGRVEIPNPLPMGRCAAESESREVVANDSMFQNKLIKS
jgi:hypothetical protein